MKEEITEIDKSRAATTTNTNTNTNTQTQNNNNKKQKSQPNIPTFGNQDTPYEKVWKIKLNWQRK